MPLGVIGKTMLVIGLAFVAAGFIAFFIELSPENQKEIISKFKDDPGKATWDSFKFAVGYDMSTPAYHLPQWIGSDDNRVFMLEEIPYPDAKLLAITIVPWLLFALFLSRVVWNSGLVIAYKLLIILLLFTLGPIVVWVIIHLIMYHWMISGAEALGIKEAALAGRAAYSASVNENQAAITYMLVATLVSFLAFSKAMIPSKK